MNQYFDPNFAKVVQAHELADAGLTTNKFYLFSSIIFASFLVEKYLWLGSRSFVKYQAVKN